MDQSGPSPQSSVSPPLLDRPMKKEAPDDEIKVEYRESAHYFDFCNCGGAFSSSIIYKQNACVCFTCVGVSVFITRARFAQSRSATMVALSAKSCSCFKKVRAIFESFCGGSGVADGRDSVWNRIRLS